MSPALLLLATALALLTAGTAAAQSGHGHGHQLGGGGDAQAHQRVAACLREFDQVVADGRGFGLAFPADQNGYPGPLQAAVAEAETARAEVRLVHLLTHVQTRDVLTETQRRTYHEIRWAAPKHP